jgi:anti-sigma factor RsiW
MILSLPDELIMAYADGELNGHLATRVRDAIRNDDAIREKHDIYCSTREVLSKSFDTVLYEPIPDRLKRIVRGRGPYRG